MKLALLPFLMSITAAHASFQFDLASTPPVAEKHPKDVSVHGDLRTDDYFWLRETENPAVLDYLKAENRYTDAVMAPTKAFQDKLYREMVGRIKETDLSVPAPKGNYLYYTRTEEGKQYPIYCRKKNAAGATEQVILDVNELAIGEKFMAVGHYEISDDGQRLAYSVDRNGHRDYEVRIKDLATGKPIEQKIGTVSSIEWMAENDTLVY